MEEVWVVLIVDICVFEGECFPLWDAFALFLIFKFIRGPPNFQLLKGIFDNWRKKHE